MHDKRRQPSSLLPGWHATRCFASFVARVRHAGLSFSLFVLFLSSSWLSWSQDTITSPLLKAPPDSAAHATPTDTLSSTDTSLLPLSRNALNQIVKYKALDSVAINLSSREAFLYNEGSIEFENMQLQANEIVVNFDKQLLSARGTQDTAGDYVGQPCFKQGGDEYNADTIHFNYGTKKGIINGVITQEGDGYLHGSKVKKINDSVMYLNKGQYTTCNYAHPHFAINFTKSKLVTGRMIATGPAYVTIEDVPTPLALPFAFFPITKGRASGLIVPSYGWMNGRGYYLKDGGYYWALNDYVDLSLLSELYTNLSWKGEVKSNYYRRYKYKGSIDASYGRTKVGIRGDSANYNVYSDFKLSWQHQQDAKANPRSRFSANVNLQSRNYNRNTTNRNDYFNSTTTSSISYNTKLGNSFNLSAAMNESFNAQTGIMNLKLPTVSLSSVTFYPLRRKVASGSYRWYENISLSYVMNADNNLTTPDSLILTRAVLGAMKYGVQHRLSAQNSVKVLKHLNWNNSVAYNERWHWSTIRKGIDSTGALCIDTVRGFRSNRDVSFTSSLTTRLYGMFNIKYGPIRALRHVVNPSVNFNFRPNLGADRYWETYTDTTGYVHRYSIFEQSLYGGPADGRSGRLGFSLGNSVEAKVKPLRDTTGELRKVTLIENLNANMSYDLAKDSLNWSDLSVTGRTTLFKNLVLNYGGTFIPYEVDTLGNKHNRLLWASKHRLFQRSNSTWSAELSWTVNSETFKKKKDKGAEQNGHRRPNPIRQTPVNGDPLLMMGSYADFSVPWSLSIRYTFSYVSTYVARQYGFEKQTVQSLNINGNFSLTENWRFTFSSGYDFVNKGLSYTSIDIYRDLHCWEMRFNWVPFGYYKSWNFVINIKAESLRDAKYEKRQTYQDNQGYYLY